MKVHNFISEMFLNQLMTEWLLFQWLTLMEDTNCMLLLWSIALRIFLISVFDGLINLQEILWRKFSLWSFTVIYVCVSCILSILPSIDKNFAIFLGSLFYLPYFVSLCISFCNIFIEQFRVVVFLHFINVLWFICRKKNLSLLLIALMSSVS